MESVCYNFFYNDKGIDIMYFFLIFIYLYNDKFLI